MRARALVVAAVCASPAAAAPVTTTFEEGHVTVVLPAGWVKVSDDSATSADQRAEIDVSFASETHDQILPDWRDFFANDGYALADGARTIAGLPAKLVTLTKGEEGEIEASLETCFGILQVDVRWQDVAHAAAAKHMLDSIALRLEAGSYVIEEDGYDREVDVRGKLPKGALGVVDDLARAICTNAPAAFLKHAGPSIALGGDSAPHLTRAQLATAIARAGGLQQLVHMRTGPWLPTRNDDWILLEGAHGLSDGHLQLRSVGGTWVVTAIFPPDPLPSASDGGG